MLRPSKEFLIRLKLNSEPAYRIAQKSGVHPTVLSRLINGIDPIHSKDWRIIQIAKLLGLTAEEAFESAEDPSEPVAQAESREGAN